MKKFLSSTRPIRTVKNCQHSIFLTFDDGPNEFTSQVLDMLGRLDCKATFFVIAEKAKKHKSILNRVISEGHSLGNHSLDHSYYNFFRSEAHLCQWIHQSQKILEDLTGSELVGFRSPAGVQTPPLARALKKLSIPWVHWRHRFYDTQILLTKKRFANKGIHMQPGDIVLLHDKQKPHFRHGFIQALEPSIQWLRVKNFDFQELRAENLRV